MNIIDRIKSWFTYQPADHITIAPPAADTQSHRLALQQPREVYLVHKVAKDGRLIRGTTRASDGHIVAYSWKTAAGYQYRWVTPAQYELLQKRNRRYQLKHAKQRNQEAKP